MLSSSSFKGTDREGKVQSKTFLLPLSTEQSASVPAFIHKIGTALPTLGTVAGVAGGSSPAATHQSFFTFVEGALAAFVAEAVEVATLRVS